MSEIKADMLIASPMRRAKASEELLASALDWPVAFEKDLQEWVGRSLSPEDFSARWDQVSEAHKPFFRFQEGYETGLDIRLESVAQGHHRPLTSSSEQLS